MKVFTEPTIDIAKNTCAGCGKEFEQPALVSSFGLRKTSNL